jgi:hypothetical protein
MHLVFFGKSGVTLADCRGVCARIPVRRRPPGRGSNKNVETFPKNVDQHFYGKC